MTPTKTTWLIAGLALSAPAFAQDMPMLPAVTLPAAEVTAPAPEKAAQEPAKAATPGLPTIPGDPVAAASALLGTDVSAPLKAAPVFSYGTATDSILFTPNQVKAMKRALSAFESIRPDTAAVPDMEVVEPSIAAEEPEKMTEPTTYPVYYLSSVAYRNPNDWTVWLNGARITPKRNSGEVVVTAVTRDRVWFSWAPTYIQAVASRQAQKSFAPVDKVKHRLASENTAALNKDKTAVTFSLRLNQSFVSGYMNTFEGKVPAPVFEGEAPLADEAPAGEGMSDQDANTISGLLGGEKNDPDRANMEGLIKNQERITPRGTPSDAPTQ